MTTEPAPERVCLPWGFLPVGKKVRAVCACGFVTTPRVNKDRAVYALTTEHGYTDPVCVLCGRNHLEGRSLHHWEALRNKHIEILTYEHGPFVVCRGTPQSCRDLTDQKMLHLGRTVAEGFGIEMPPPRLRLV
ncbi:hypothetical protein [Nocardia salmonicida]|uniref:hypothetical protein n=1 Tax=Nocardia salmonicida TaxID=53431 RepID=UPI0007A4D282|nr:hypothetical protein [Nocardia salmonicida]